ncbi:unnamed protein product, partial [Polarella glacialis]
MVLDAFGRGLRAAIRAVFTAEYLGGVVGRSIWAEYLGGVSGGDSGGVFGRRIWAEYLGGVSGGVFGRSIWAEYLGGVFGRSIWAEFRAEYSGGVFGRRIWAEYLGGVSGGVFGRSIWAEYSGGGFGRKVSRAQLLKRRRPTQALPAGWESGQSRVKCSTCRVDLTADSFDVGRLEAWRRNRNLVRAVCRECEAGKEKSEQNLSTNNNSHNKKKNTNRVMAPPPQRSGSSDPVVQKQRKSTTTPTTTNKKKKKNTNNNNKQQKVRTTTKTKSSTRKKPSSSEAAAARSPQGGSSRQQPQQHQQRQHHQQQRQQQQQQQQSLDEGLHRGHAEGLHYLLRSPGPQQQQLPLLLFLHGSGERGPEDGTALKLVQRHGPWRMPGSQQWLILAPQCHTDRTWPGLASEVLQLLKHIVGLYSVDTRRLYLTGLSLGAFGVWSVASQEPGLFAALLPICGGFAQRMPRDTVLRQVTCLAKEAPAKQRLASLSRIPCWMFHGSLDKSVSVLGTKLLAKGLRSTSRAGLHHLRATILRGEGHHIWCKVYARKDVASWLAKQRKRAKKVKE